ncbi:hypothetical protein HFP89_14290 [Wenzhouxiangella sp. XN79A]|uniref:hypothetical protein n=1 Tax=Wenzhouxiangella sp. XN79A TaxID=2724193 RepID=UPI00144A5964|nr:hypothetical protein [Wenzhouxiangella sp. XN79A]NKI36336.1 hypothetical protein [Wenzhouxiangella sp. XN79A]
MRKFLALVCAGLLLAGCGEREAAEAASSAEDGSGTVSGTLDGVPFRLEARCIDHPTDRFRFRSEESNGMRLSGMQRGDKLIVDYTDGASNFSTPNLETFEKSATGASGSGALFAEGGGANVDLVFQLRCD